ncbi:E3 ubiquitin/ISG15 ligase TRIM25 isoform X1 [Oncorhynchus tshawytscha]|uniref:RING-type E3 ubiquitin transferase n=1 Tax=Oncorhynchus tshawytscha TaxID=74940 RepID=A0A8C8HPM4_ONCTS|nr:E3 ubiquitin/ISG15 ligase TRIM25 isoform X1 [Oncorhynchus tshawytscha]
MAEDMFSLMSLEDELSCSICLCAFDCPVTIPCGHNFCQECLLETWKDNYSCPQCRTHFTTKPELKKNTVLSTVVETFKMKSNKSDLPSEVGDLIMWDAVKMEPKEVAILCDTCMEAKAFKTCLTCMASFCLEHVRPHHENPVFGAHQLNEPLGDLRDRICTDHHKLMEFYCVQHGRCICGVCLQQVHKGCTFSSPDEQRALQESDLRGKLSLLDGKIDKNQTVISQMSDQQSKLKDSAASRKRALEDEYRQIRELLDRDEREALNTVDREQESAQTKLQNLIKKFNQNITKLSAAKDGVDSLLSQTQTVAFLQASVDMPAAVAFDPYTPKVNLDSKALAAWHAYSAVLREHLTHVLKQPVEARLQILKPAERFAPPLLPNFFEMGGMPPQGHPRMPRSHSPGAPLRANQRKKPPQDSNRERKSDKKRDHKEGKEHKADKNPQKPPNAPREFATPVPHTPRDHPRGQSAEPRNREDPGQPSVLPSITSAAKRNDLLQYGTVLTLDLKTAHKRISLTENMTVASVSDEPTPYPDGPARFSVCSQVLTSKGFSRGRHYWEVKMSSNNFTGIGLAYNSIDRKGPASRLGRNAQSWCVEWFNVKLSAWHASSETVLQNPNPTRVGVLLDCEEGTATFYNVQDRAYPFHTFVFQFAEAVYPAFWLFSSGSSVSLCKLQS